MPVLTPFQPRHIAAAHLLSQAAGWPHRPQDWALVLSLSKGVVALHQNQVIATALATDFGQVATANMIIVAAAHRGQGLGQKVMQAALNQLTPQQWRLIATPDGMPLYHKMGFAADGRIAQYQGFVTRPATQVAIAAKAGLADLDALCAMDLRATGMDRRRFYHALLTQAAVYIARQNGQITALAGVRRFGLGHLLGPVIAPSADDARALIAPIIAAHTGQFLRIDCPQTATMGDWLGAQGLTHADSGVLMHKGVALSGSNPHHIFGLAAQALG